MAMATTFSSAVAMPNLGAAVTIWQRGPLTVQQAASPSGAYCKRSPAVVAVRAQRVEEETTRSGLVSTVMALAGAAMLASSVGSAEAAIQKVEGREREEQDAVTTGIKEPSRLSAGKGNTVQEGARQNTQASGGLILGAPKLDEPAGAYRSPQSNTYGVDDVGSKRSTPAGILQGKSAGKSGAGGSEGAQIGGSSQAD